MPTVPRRQVGYVSQTPTQGANPGNAFMPPQPVDIGPAAGAIAQLVEKHQTEQDQNAVLDADNQLSQLSTSLEVQTLQKRGKDAIGAGLQVEDQWKRQASDIENGLANDRQKEAFRVRSDHHFQMLNETVQKHEATEAQNYGNDTIAATIENSRNNAIKHVDDPLIIGQSVAETKDLISELGSRNGWSSAEVQQKQAIGVSGIHSGVVKLLADSGQDLSAKEYFTAHKDELSGNDLLQTAAIIKESSVKGESQRQRDLIMKTASSMTDAIAQARLIKDPDVQEATERLVKQDFAERAAGLRDSREQLMTQAGNIIDQTGSYESIPASIRSILSPSEKSSLLEYANRKNTVGGVKTDLSAYYNLETLATTPETRDKFLQLDLNQYRSKLSPSDFEEMVKLQGSVRKGDAAAEAKLQWTQTKHQIVGSVMNTALIGISKRGKVSDVAARSAFRSAVDTEVERIQSSTNKPVTPEQVKTIANEMAMQHIVERPGFFWGTNEEPVRTFQMRPGEKIILGIKDVPSAQRTQIQQALQSRGRAVTDAAIVDWYRRYIQQLAPEPE